MTPMNVSKDFTKTFNEIRCFHDEYKWIIHTEENELMKNKVNIFPHCFF